MKNFLSILCAKCTILGLKLLKAGSGTSLPGKLALKVSPKVLGKLVSQTKKEIISITGTNGKTTTSGLVASILNADSRKIAHNQKGANMLTGVATSVLASSSLCGKLDVDNSLFECDEAYLPVMADYFTADCLLVTNLFKDQLDRYGDFSFTAKKIGEAIRKFSAKDNFEVILNADVPVVVALSANNINTSVYYGFENIVFENSESNLETPSEAVSCPCCDKNLVYSKTFYGSVGHYSCSCGFSRPASKYKSEAVIKSDGSILVKVEVDGTIEEFFVNLPGVYNAYNALGAIVLALELGISADVIRVGLLNYKTMFGRAERFNIKGKSGIIQLVKNPAGATEVLRTVKDDPASRLLIAINDNYADGRDISWLWDTDFELLNKHNKQIFVSGLRAYDVALRLKYAGIENYNIKVIENFETAVKSALNSTKEDEKLYVLPCYTALMAMQKFMNKL